MPGSLGIRADGTTRRTCQNAREITLNNSLVFGAVRTGERALWAILSTFRAHVFYQFHIRSTVHGVTVQLMLNCIRVDTRII